MIKFSITGLEGGEGIPGGDETGVTSLGLGTLSLLSGILDGYE